MIYDNLQELTDYDLQAVPVNDKLQKINQHEEMGFPMKAYPNLLSAMYLKRIRWHWHAEIELTYVVSGCVNAYIGEDILPLHTGQCILINQNILHAFRRIEKQDANLHTIVFHPAFFFGYGNPALSAKYLNPIISNPAMKYLLISEEDTLTSPLYRYVTQIYDTYTQADFGYELQCKALFCNLWLALLKLPNKTVTPALKSKRAMNDEQRIKEGIRYIEEHFAEPITLNDIAESIHISKSECCRCFQRVLQVTPFEYLLKYRIFYATRMIQRQDPAASSISNLAISVGFANISYFTKVFKRFLHMTPTEYKEQQQKELSHTESTLPK